MAKMTKLDRLGLVRDALVEAGETELVTFVEKEMETLEKRKGAERKPTKDQEANMALKADMVDFLADAEVGVTATELATEFDVSVQKVAQLVKQLVTAGEVTRTEGKGKEKTTFSVG
jgi:predicted transcriptional regulator